MKIALIYNFLCRGGDAKVGSILSHYFVKSGIDVHNIVFADKIEYSYSGKLLELDSLKDKSNSLWSRYKRFIVLKKYLKQNEFDFIIDFRFKKYFLQEYILHNFVYYNHIQTIHSSNFESYLLGKWYSKILYPKRIKFVTISENLKDKLQTIGITANFISNPVEVSKNVQLSEEVIQIDKPYILAAGRLDNHVKQFDVLIECYSKSILKDNVDLIILGDGRIKNYLIQKVKEFNVESKVIFKGNVNNVFPYLKNSLFCCLTSKYEGLPMVILESFSVGTPYVSFDCPTGPAQLIKNRTNGILVENQNKEKFIEAMNEMYLDKDLYENCKKNTKSSLQSFDIENIGKLWLELFSSLSNKI